MFFNISILFLLIISIVNAISIEDDNINNVALNDISFQDDFSRPDSSMLNASSSLFYTRATETDNRYIQIDSNALSFHYYRVQPSRPLQRVVVSPHLVGADFVLDLDITFVVNFGFLIEWRVLNSYPDLYYSAYQLHLKQNTAELHYGKRFVANETLAQPFEKNKNYVVRIVAQNDRFKVFINQNQIIDVRDASNGFDKGHCMRF
jgi:hypothetical protein